MKIPRSHTFPGGFKVVVRHIAETKMADLNGTDTAPDSLWIWDKANGGTIYLERGKDYYLKHKDFVHELGHAFNEWRTFYDRKAGGLG